MADFAFNPAQLSAAKVQPLGVDVTSFAGGKPVIDRETFEFVQEGPARAAESNLRRLSAEQKFRQLKADEKFNVLPAVDQAMTQSYMQQYGGVPRTATGEVDIEKIRTESENIRRTRVANAQLAAAMNGLQQVTYQKPDGSTGLRWIDPTSGAVVREFDLSPTGAVVTSVGGEAVKGAAGLQKRLTPLQQAQEMERVAGIEDIQSRMTAIGEKLRQRGDVVGPLAGSALGQGWAWIKAVLGDKEQFNAQRQATQVISFGAIEAANKLKGPLTEKELGFLRNSMPKLSDTEEVWFDWLARMERLNKRILLEKTAQLEGRAITKEELDAAVPPAVTDAEAVTTVTVP